MSPENWQSIFFNFFREIANKIGELFVIAILKVSLMKAYVKILDELLQGSLEQVLDFQESNGGVS